MLSFRLGFVVRARADLCGWVSLLIIVQPKVAVGRL